MTIETTLKKNEKLNHMSAESRGTKDSKETEKTQDKSFTERMDEAISAKSTSLLLTALQDATPEELTQLGNDSSKLKSITKLKKDENQNACLDIIYEHVTNIADMERIFEQRFGVNLGSGSAKSLIFKLNSFIGAEDENQWTLKGVKRLYKNYLLVPQSQIDELDSVLTSTKKGKKDKNGKKQPDSHSGGFAVGAYDCYTVRYTDDTMDNESGTGYCDSKDDRRYHLSATDCTMLHELGHVVDTGSYVYSSREDFRSISGWKYEGKDAEEIVTKIEQYAKQPYDASLNADEKAIAHIGAVQMIKHRNRKLTEASIREHVKKGYKQLGKSIDAKPENKSILAKLGNKITGKTDNGDYRPLDDLLIPLINSTVYGQIEHGMAEEKTNYIPCYDHNGGINTEMNTQIQEGYEKRGWYSFNTNAWNDKISRYQFREPCEEFAELYATYHLSQGTNVKAGHKTWFEGMGLHNGTQDPKKAPIKFNEGERASDIQQS